MAEDIRLPSSSFAELKKIIQGYAHYGENVQLDDLAKLLGINKTTISPNNPALTELGLIEGGKTKNATPLGVKLGRALEHNYQEDIKRYLQEIVQGNQFLSSVISTVRIKKRISVDDLVAHVLYASGQKNNKANRTGSRTYVDMLLESGLLVENNGQVVVAVGDAIPAPKQTSEKSTFEPQQESENSTQPNLSFSPSEQDMVQENLRPSNISIPPTKIAINIQLQIPATENPQVYENLFKALRKHLLDPVDEHDA